MKKNYYLSSKLNAIALIIVVIVLVNSLNSIAKETDREQSIVLALEAADHFKKEFGLENVDFNHTTVSSPIHTYVYINHAVIPASKLYPVKYQGKLIGWVNNYQTSYFQFTTSLVSSILEVYKENTTFSLIYSSDTCFYYDGISLIPIYYFNEEIPERSKLNDLEDIDSSLIKFSGLENEEIILNPNISSITSAYVSCGVNYVSQHPYSNICWAASAACIANHVNFSNYTAYRVSEIHNHGTFLNWPLPPSMASTVLQEIGITDYNYLSYVPSDGILYKNINANKPIYSVFEKNNIYHNCVVYSISLTGGYIGVMDPWNGYMIAHDSANGFQYMASDNQEIYRLSEVICKYTN